MRQKSSYSGQHYLIVTVLLAQTLAIKIFFLFSGEVERLSTILVDIELIFDEIYHIELSNYMKY